MKRALLFLLVAIVLSAFGQRSWIQKNPPPFTGRYALVSFVIGNYAYAGLGSIDAEQRIYSAEFYRYDPVADLWTRMPDFPGGRRYSATAFALNGKGYICNGVDSTHMWRSDVWEFDPGSETWTQKNPFPGGDRYGSGSFVIGDQAYLVAGSYNAGFDYLKDLWCYTPLTDTWTRKADLPVDHKSGAVAFAFNGQGYAGCGAENTYQTTGDFYRYNPETDAWTTLPNLPVNISGALGFVLEDTAYVGTGTDLVNTYRSFYRLTQPPSSWMPLPDPPTAFRERISGTAFTIGSTAYVLAGRTRPLDPYSLPGTLLNDLWSYTACRVPSAGFTFEVHDQTVAFHDSSTQAIHRAWSFGDGTLSIEENPVHTYSRHGTYIVRLNVANECGLDSVCRTVVIRCGAPEARIGFSINFPDVQFSDLSVTGPLISRLWDFGDGTYSTDANPFHTYTDPGSYRVCLTVADSCATDSVCGTLSLLMPMALQVSVTPESTNDLLAQFTDHTPGTTHWHWDFGDGGSSDQQNPSHLYKEYGSYNVCLAAGNATSAGLWCDTLEMKINPSLHHANPVVVYPNPSAGRVFARYYRTCAESRVQVTDFTGRVVSDKMVRSGGLPGEEEIDLTGAPGGVYFVRVSCDEFSRIWKVVIL